jgi:DNA polymerase-3 subunit beta
MLEEKKISMAVIRRLPRYFRYLSDLIKLDINDDQIVITSDSQLGKAREEVNVLMQGEPLKIAFNARFVIDVLKIMDEEEIVLELTSSVSPCVLKNKDKNNCTYLVLPVRVVGM